MNSTSLQHKTVRPGSLVGYSYYHSDRRPPAMARPMPRLSSSRHLLRWGLLAVVVAAVLIAVPMLRGGSTPAHGTAAQSSAGKTPVTGAPKTTPAAAPAQTVVTNHCAGQTGQLVLVSISQRHLWACHDGQTAYDSPVVTGIEYLAADKTPPGTYHIYGKQTDTTLTGSDTTGSWSDPVHYWMPFLHNQYGSYGFHDATWRDNSAFGNIDPNSADASHGCVELPLATAAWLYNWASVGTTVTIQS